MLCVRDLKTHLFLKRGVLKAVDGVSFDLAGSETLGLIGESGSGKTMTGLSLLGLPPKPAGRIVDGSIALDGRELIGLDEKTLAEEIRGRQIAMISQDPMTSLNPVFTIGNQVAAPIRAHRMAAPSTAESEGAFSARRARRNAALDLAVEELQHVRVPAANERFRDYPHQFSGGMRQRVVAAMAIGCRPRVLIADEPTSALDVTIQVQLMDLIERIQADTGAGLVFITHDLGVAARVCQRIAVMYAGRIVETTSASEFYAEPKHPYSRGLLASVPRLGRRAKRLTSIPGNPPNPLDLPSGCAFHPRCPNATAQCRAEAPPLVTTAENNQVACWLHA